MDFVDKIRILKIKKVLFFLLNPESQQKIRPIWHQKPANKSRKLPYFSDPIF